MKPFHYVVLALVLLSGLAGSVLLIPGDADLGLMYFRGRQYSQARPLLEKRLAAGDRSVDVIMPLAELYVQSGAVDRAVGLLRRMNGSNADQMQLFRKVAVLQKYNQQMRDYLHTLETIEHIAGSEDGLRELIDQYRYANDHALLIPALQTLLARYKGEPGEYVELANILAAGARFAESAGVMERFEARHPREVSAETVELLLSVLLDSHQGWHALDRAGQWVAQHRDADTVVRFASLLRGKGEPVLAARLLAPFESEIDANPVLLAEWLQQKLAAGQTPAAFARLDRLRREKRLSDELMEPFLDLALAKGDVDSAMEAAGQFGFHRLRGALLTMLAERALAGGRAAAASRAASAGGADFLDEHPLLAARLAFARGDWAEAARCLKNAEKNVPLNGADRLAIAGLDVSLARQMEAAEQLALIPLEAAPADWLLETARLYVTIGKPAEGLQRFARIRRGSSTMAIDQAWALLGAAGGRGKEVARWMQASDAHSIPEALLRDLYHLAQDHRQPELAVAAAERLFREYAGNAHRLMLAKALLAASQPAAALSHVRALLSGSEPEAEEVYTAALLGAMRSTPAGAAGDFRKELRTFWSRKLDQAGQDERRQLELIYGLLDLGAWEPVLPKLELLARRHEDLAPLFIATALKAGKRQAAVDFLKADLAREGLTKETREARVYALLEAGGLAEALPYMNQLARAGVPPWIGAYEDALRKLGRGGELLNFWRDRLNGAAVSQDEQRGIAYKLIDAGKPEWARAIFGELAKTAAPDSPDVAEWLFLWGSTPGREVAEWLEGRARRARAADRLGWLNRLLEVGAPGRVVAVVSDDPPASGSGGPLFDTYIHALAAQGRTDSLAGAIAREAGAVAVPERVRKIAALAREAGGIAAASPAYERLAALDPTDPEALHWLGVFAYSRARYSVAERCLHALLASSEGGFDDNYHYAEILWRQGKRSQARAYYGRAMRLIERLPSPPVEARAIHAQALFRCGYLQRAQREYRTLIAAEPRNGDLRADFGVMLLEAAQYNEAGEVLSGGVDSGGARVGLVRAQLFSATGHVPDAMELLQSLTEENTQLAGVAAAFGVMEQSAGRNRRAQALLTRAAAMDPNNEDFRDALAALGRERAGKLLAETEYRVIQGVRSEDLVRLSGQAAISRDLRVVFSAEQDHVSIPALQLMDGSRAAYEGVRRRSEAALLWESESGVQLKASLFAGGPSHGVGFSALRPDPRGSAGLAIEIGRPDWDFGESLAQGGVRDRLEVRRDTTLNARTSVQLGAAVNRYDLPGVPGAAESVAATGSVNVRLLRAPQLFLNYSFDAEYLLDAKVHRAPDGRSFRPLPLVSREVHATSVRIEKQLTRGLHAAGTAGVAVDRLGGRAPFFSGSLTYDRSRHVGARLDFDRRSYPYDSRQIAASFRAGVFWRF